MPHDDVTSVSVRTTFSSGLGYGADPEADSRADLLMGDSWGGKYRFRHTLGSKRRGCANWAMIEANVLKCQPVLYQFGYRLLVYPSN